MASAFRNQTTSDSSVDFRCLLAHIHNALRACELHALRDVILTVLQLPAQNCIMQVKWEAIPKLISVYFAEASKKGVDIKTTYIEKNF